MKDAAQCEAVEIAAASRFMAVGMPEMVEITKGDPFARTYAAEHAEAGHLFVAADRSNTIVGFAAFWPIDGFAHVCEIDVLPDHAGQHLGRRLMTAGEDWARLHGLTAMTLATFTDVPWNAPWYARLGFRPYLAGDWTEGHQAIWRHQLASALDCTRRCLMIKDLSAPDNASGTS